MSLAEKLNLTQKLLYIQQNLKVPKNQRNKFGDFKYRSCEDILEAVKPLLKETKTVLLISDDIQIRGDRFYVMATATLKDTESSETIDNRHMQEKRITRQRWMPRRLQAPAALMQENTH